MEEQERSQATGLLLNYHETFDWSIFTLPLKIQISQIEFLEFMFKALIYCFHCVSSACGPKIVY